MRHVPAFFFFPLIFLYSLANTLALPLANASSTLSLLNINSSFVTDEGHFFPIPSTPLTLHFTLLRPQTPLPYENTLSCLHKLAKSLSEEPPSKYLEKMRTQTTNNVEAIIAPTHCSACGFTYRESCKVLAGLWYYASREQLLYAQRYGVFNVGTGTMVAWGTLVATPAAPGGSAVMDMVSTLPSGLIEAS